MDAMAAGGDDDGGGPFAQRSPEFITAEIDDLCTFGREKFTDLEKAIKTYKGGRK